MRQNTLKQLATMLAILFGFTLPTLGFAEEASAGHGYGNHANSPVRQNVDLIKKDPIHDEDPFLVREATADGANGTTSVKKAWQVIATMWNLADEDIVEEQAFWGQLKGCEEKWGKSYKQRDGESEQAYWARCARRGGKWSREGYNYLVMDMARDAAQLILAEVGSKKALRGCNVPDPDHSGDDEAALGCYIMLKDGETVWAKNVDIKWDEAELLRQLAANDRFVLMAGLRWNTASNNAKSPSSKRKPAKAPAKASPPKSEKPKVTKPKVAPPAPKSAPKPETKGA